MDVSDLNPILKKIYKDQKKKPSDNERKERFARIRNVLNRKSKPNNKK